MYRYGLAHKSYEQITSSKGLFVAGIAVDETGQPVGGVSVQVCCHKRPHGEEGNFRWKFSGEFDVLNAKTDAQGHFAIELEEDGFYNLRFSPKNHAAIIAYDIPVGTIKADIERTLLTWGVRGQPWLILTDRNHTVTAEGFGINELDEKIRPKQTLGVEHNSAAVKTGVVMPAAPKQAQVAPTDGTSDPAAMATFHYSSLIPTLSPLSHHSQSYHRQIRQGELTTRNWFI